jgi:hypothetical protein
VGNSFFAGGEKQQKNSNNLSALIARFLLASSHTAGSTHLLLIEI